MAAEVGRDGEGVVNTEEREDETDNDEILVIEAIVQMRPVRDIHFARQEEPRLIPISLPRVRWLERAEP